MLFLSQGQYIFFIECYSSSEPDHRCDWFLPRPKDEGAKLKYIKEVYFDYTGLIWNIEGEAEMEMVDQLKADFDHILESFKILGKSEPENW